MTGPEHYREAERLDRQADQWMDADTGWKAGLTVEERLAYRTADQAAAQTHATLALAAAQPAVMIPPGMVLVAQCRITESAHGRQCLKGTGHSDGHDFGDGDA
ncbi:hypothetical protein [Streptomyces sp. NPDC001205]